MVAGTTLLSLYLETLAVATGTKLANPFVGSYSYLARIKTGRFKKVKMEPEATEEGAATFETDPFKALSAFLNTANTAAGAGGS